MGRKKYYYCIDFRSMHTAVHGLLGYFTRIEAEKIYTKLKKDLNNLEKNVSNGIMEDTEFQLKYQCILDEIFNNADYILEEIDYREIEIKTLGNKVKRIEKMYDSNCIIINDISLDLYL